MNEPILWSTSATDAFNLMKQLQSDELLNFDYLTDITAYDNVDGQDGPKRFVVVYQLFSTKTQTRLRIKLAIDPMETPESLTPLWPGANWLEREVYDMFGVKFKGHPNLRRILMDERFTGFPLRKEYPLKQREQFPDNVPLHLGSHPLAKEERSDEKYLHDFYNPNVLLNIGPAHPAMHGTLRIMCRLNGETIEDAACEIGYLHRGMEKLGENKTYHQWIVYTDRMNYCSALNNNIAYCMTVENLMGISITERCMWVRMILMELSRIIDHIICVAINALDMGAMTVFWLMYYWREEAYTMIESLCGMRLTTTATRVGGMAYDLPEDFIPRLKKFVKEFPSCLVEIHGLLTGNRIWIDRTKNVGKLSKEDALKFSITGPCLRASGIDLDLRRDRPYYAYHQVKFDVVVGSHGDVFERYLVRMEEMRQSVRIIEQCIQRLPGGPIWVDDPRVRIPEKIDVYTKMEVLIHHFKIFMEGINVPPGELYNAVEGPNGELGFYILSKGGPKAWRMRVKAPSFMLFQSFEHSVVGDKIPDAIANLGSLNIIAGELDR
ncbi:MAG: NADH dehydrogenase (quinone) subunit D [Bdellovibrionales bacterium GWA2_49_15]|nr:MAG: NADH dehydrogenase (quinone) subunit D [Bdellovibrionales bacterium GWA2_49_15]